MAFVASIFQHFRAFHLPVLEGLVAKGVEVHAFARDDAGRAAVEAAGVVCHDLPLGRSPLHAGNLRALRLLTESFRRERFDLVHLHTPVAGVLGRLAAGRAGVRRVVYTAHGFHFHEGAPWVNWLLYYPVERWLSRRTDELVVMNGEDYRWALTFPVRGRVRYVPGVGLDTAAYRPESVTDGRRLWRMRLGLEERELAVLCLGELNANKNQLQLLEAVRLLAERGRRVHLLLAGEGPTEAVLRAYAARWRLEGQVHFLGYRPEVEVAELLAATDVCALVSKREGLPRSLMEAMAAGKPIVATRIRGNRDLVMDGGNGMLVPEDDAHALADALAVLGADRQLRERMGHLSEVLAQSYDLAAVLPQLMRIYEPGGEEVVPLEKVL